MLPSLKVTRLSADADASVLAVAGEIDRDTIHFLHDAAEEAIALGSHRLVLDLTGVTFCDSSGLSTFVELHRRTTTLGGWTRLAGLSGDLHGILRVTNLDRLLPIYDTVEQALTEPGGPVRP